MQIASSASCTWSDWTSASEYTARVLMPISRQARTIRRAISPRLAMRTFWIIGSSIVLGSSSGNIHDGSGRFRGHRSALPQFEKALPVFHRLAVLDQDLDDR